MTAGRNKDAERARELIKDPATNTELRRILDATAAEYDLNPRVLQDAGDGTRGTLKVQDARTSAYWLVRVRLGLSYPVIGAIFGRDHSTVISGVQKVANANVTATLKGYVTPAKRIDGVLGSMPVEVAQC